MYTIFKVFRPTAPVGRTPRGPSSNTAPSSLRVELNQPPHLPDSSSSTIYISRGGTVVSVHLLLSFMLNVPMKVDLLNENITLKTDSAALTVIASSMIISGLFSEASMESLFAF